MARSHSHHDHRQSICSAFLAPAVSNSRLNRTVPRSARRSQRHHASLRLQNHLAWAQEEGGDGAERPGGDARVQALVKLEPARLTNSE